MISDFVIPLGWLGTAGPNESLWAGVIIFFITGFALFYLSFINNEMDAGPVLKAMSIVLIFFGVLSLFWPIRPWA